MTRSDLVNVNFGHSMISGYLLSLGFSNKRRETASMRIYTFSSVAEKTSFINFFHEGSPFHPVPRGKLSILH